ncbi:hypothetical protein [Streptomyces sp. NPDC017448]|uniref:hypothetical protein n=1 Tax=Streptomyces sp. NPDC017448 TaxID=3364996 RepID=UPI0037BC88F2
MREPVNVEIPRIQAEPVFRHPRRRPRGPGDLPGGAEPADRPAVAVRPEDVAHVGVADVGHGSTAEKGLCATGWSATLGV